MEHLSIEKNNWFVYYEDEDGEKHNRGFPSELQANSFVDVVIGEGGVLLKVYKA